MIIAAIAIVVIIALLLYSMRRNRDLTQTLWQRLFASLLIIGIVAFLAVVANVALLFPGVQPILAALAAIGLFLMIIFAIIGARQQQTRNQDLADAWAVIASLEAAKPPTITAVYGNPYLEIYQQWDVRKRSDGKYQAVPLIKGAPRWKAADPAIFADPGEAWNHAIELREVAAQLAISASK